MEEYDEYVEKAQMIFLSPVMSILEDNDSVDDLRSYLDMYNSYKIHNAMVEGANNFLSVVGDTISRDIVGDMKCMFSELKDKAENLSEVWEILDEYERTEVLNNISEGIFSDETLVCAALGTLILPGIGTAIGAFLGGQSAGKRVQGQLKRLIEYHSAGMSSCIKTYIDNVESFTYRYFNDVIEQFEQQEQKKMIAASGGSLIDEIEKLAKLRKDGIITDEEFVKLKKAIIG